VFMHAVGSFHAREDEQSVLPDMVEEVMACMFQDHSQSLQQQTCAPRRIA